MASFFGDGATEEGVFAESLNFAVAQEAADPVRLREQRLRDPQPSVRDRQGRRRHLRARSRAYGIAGGA